MRQWAFTQKGGTRKEGAKHAAMGLRTDGRDEKRRRKTCGNGRSHRRARQEKTAQNMRQWALKKKKTCGNGPSRVVPHRSTTPSRPSLTSLFEWEAVTLGDVAACEEQAHRQSISAFGSIDQHARAVRGVGATSRTMHVEVVLRVPSLLSGASLSLPPPPGCRTHMIYGVVPMLQVSTGWLAKRCGVDHPERPTTRPTHVSSAHTRRRRRLPAWQWIAHVCQYLRRTVVAATCSRVASS